MGLGLGDGTGRWVLETGLEAAHPEVSQPYQRLNHSPQRLKEELGVQP